MLLMLEKDFWPSNQLNIPCFHLSESGHIYWNHGTFWAERYQCINDNCWHFVGVNQSKNLNNTLTVHSGALLCCALAAHWFRFQSQLSSSDPVTIDIYYKLKIIKLEGAHDKITVEAAHKSCVSCVLRCGEKGEVRRRPSAGNTARDTHRHPAAVWIKCLMSL